MKRPADWMERVNRPLKLAELERLRTSVNRGRPFGRDDWMRGAARTLGLQHTLRNPGRPKKGVGED